MLSLLKDSYIIYQKKNKTTSGNSISVDKTLCESDSVPPNSVVSRLVPENESQSINEIMIYIADFYPVTNLMQKEKKFAKIFSLRI